MRILLTGSFGNIGEDVLKLLLKVGHQVRCFDIQTGEEPKELRLLVEKPSEGT